MEDFFLKTIAIVNDTRFYWGPVLLLIILSVTVWEIGNIFADIFYEMDEYTDEQ